MHGGIEGIQELIKHFEEFSVIHVYREANSVANKLAGIGTQMDRGLVVYDDPSFEVAALMYLDVLGSCTPRLVSV
jgi:3-mercaptopyruvate sulfurtransferase SseA